MSRGPQACYGSILLAFVLGTIPATLANSNTTREITTAPTVDFIRVDQIRVTDHAEARERELHTRYVGHDGKETTAAQIAAFLNQFRSPMEQHSHEIVRAANRYGVDPKLIVAIAGVESTFGRKCRGYNAWGWNGGRTRWSSWSESIEEYTRLLSENYPNRDNVRRVARTYNPNTPEAWGRKVNYLMASIESTAPVIEAVG